MQVKTLVLAVAATLAAAPAFAVSNPEAVSGVQTIVMGGATAPDGFIRSAAEDMLKPGFFTYRNNDLGSAFQHRAWYGFAKAGIPGVLENTPILFVKRSRGGSVIGVNPVARADRIQSLDFANCSTGGAADGTTYNYFCGVKGLDPGSPGFANPAMNHGVVLDMGVSDVAPALFKSPLNVEFSAGELAASEAAVLTAFPVNTLMMSFVATNSVPLTTRLTRAAYGNMLMGGIQDWTQIDASLTGNTQVVVCRRANGSGTQAAYNWYFNNFPCQAAFNGAVPPADMGTNGTGGNNASGIVGGNGLTAATAFQIDPTAGYTVVNNLTSGDVRNCLARAQTNQDHTFRADDGLWYSIRFSNSTVPFRAIGALSLDSYPADGPTWTFRMMDGAGRFTPATQTASAGATGIAPSKANLLSGAWDFGAELTMQYRNATVVNAQGDSVPPLSGVRLAFANEFIKRSGDPAQIAANSRALAYSAMPDFHQPNLNAINAAQVAVGSRGGNMCAPWQQRF